MIKSDNAMKPFSVRKKIQLSNAIFERMQELDESFPLDPVPILQKAEIDAKNIRKQAEQEAERIRKDLDNRLEQAKKEMEEAFASAKSQGYQEGYQLGMQEGEKAYETLIKEARQIIDSAKKDRQERLEQTEYDILNLSTALAEKVIGTVLPENDSRWLDMVKKAVSEVKEHEEVRLIVHHKWFDFMMMHKKELRSLLKNSAEFYIYPESSLDEFSCIIEFPNGRIDAGVDSQLTEIKKKLSAKLEDGHDRRNNLD
ncbi:MAG TPA: flagellar assembly protein FliH [Bacillales bacterium]|nr:flagellar assembly protein FliH [Bacillales bacterium]